MQEIWYVYTGLNENENISDINERLAEGWHVKMMVPDSNPGTNTSGVFVVLEED